MVAQEIERGNGCTIIRGTLSTRRSGMTSTWRVHNGLVFLRSPSIPFESIEKSKGCSAKFRGSRTSRHLTVLLTSQ